MRSDATLQNEFCKTEHNWQTKNLKLVPDLSFVILNLLKEKFVVEIRGFKYDLSFGKNKKNGEIGYGWSSAPSPHLTSSEIIELAFREGIWYVIQE